MRILGKNYKACYLVPARKSSVRIKHKNVRKIDGKELVLWPKQEADELGIDYIVSTNCPKAINVCKKNEVRYAIRPDSTDTDEISTLDLLVLHAKRFNTYELFGLRQCTSPFLSTETARKCFELSATTGMCVQLVTHDMRKHEMTKTGGLYVVPKGMIEEINKPESWLFVSVGGAEAVDIDTPQDLRGARKWITRL